MRKIIAAAMVSLDGVMQSPGGATEDPTRGFKFGGWVMPHFDQAAFEEIDRLFKDFDLLLGRKTYEIFAGYWPFQDHNSQNGGIAKAFDEAKKYVVSRKGEVDTGWKGSVLLRDLAAVKRLRETEGPNLVTQGSTELLHGLFANDLVDAMTLIVVPVVLGGGKKLFADGSVPHAYRLTRTRVTDMGVVIAHYERGGEIKLGTADALDQPSELELVRREKMEREG